MVDEILPEKKFRIPIGFEKRVRSHAAFVDFIFVGINETRVGMPIDLEGDQRERVFGEGIIVVEKHTPFATRQFERRVRSG